MFVTETLANLSQRHVQGHHDNEPDDGSPGGELAVPLGLTLGDDIVHDDVDHGAGGECEGVRQDGDDECDEGGAEHARHRLHQPGQLPVPGDGRRQQSVDSGLVS